jgi:geranylgeranyl diphosphate synthase type II
MSAQTTPEPRLLDSPSREAGPVVLPTLAAALSETERRLDRFFDEQMARAGRHAGPYPALWQALQAATQGGKRLRPRLLLGAFLHLGGVRLEPAIELAVAVELLHTALLVHDDVIDGDVQRRGAPNVVGTFAAAGAAGGLAPEPARRWGEHAALLAGDLLLTSAVRVTARLDVDEARRAALVELVDESVFRAAAGELADVAYAAGLLTPTPTEIRDTMADKTAHYSLELPLRAAAILAGSPAPVAARLGAIGRSLGTVFQMQDDLLGVFGRTAETGKSASNDLREGKQTLLVAAARGRAPWRAVEHLFGRPDLDDEGAERLRAALETCGARRRAERALRDERDTTLALVDRAALPAGLSRLLVHEAERAAERRS